MEIAIRLVPAMAGRGSPQKATYGSDFGMEEGQ